MSKSECKNHIKPSIMVIGDSTTLEIIHSLKKHLKGSANLYWVNDQGSEMVNMTDTLDLIKDHLTPNVENIELNIGMFQHVAITGNCNFGLKETFERMALRFSSESTGFFDQFPHSSSGGMRKPEFLESQRSHKSKRSRRGKFPIYYKKKHY